MAGDLPIGGETPFHVGRDFTPAWNYSNDDNDGVPTGLPIALLKGELDPTEERPVTAEHEAHGHADHGHGHDHHDEPDFGRLHFALFGLTCGLILGYAASVVPGMFG